MDHKIAQTSEKLNENILKRWSPRAFSGKPVEEALLVKIFEAARWAASSFNEQPWRFIVGQKSEMTGSYDKILDTLVKFNQDWAKNAPVLILVCAKKTFSHNGKPNKHYFYDAGQAVTTMSLQAVQDDLYMHQMAGFDPEIAREAFGIPKAYDAVAVVALGYVAEASILPDSLQEGEQQLRNRKPLEEILFVNKWEESFIN